MHNTLDTTLLSSRKTCCMYAHTYTLKQFSHHHSTGHTGLTDCTDQSMKTQAPITYVTRVIHSHLYTFRHVHSRTLPYTPITSPHITSHHITSSHLISSHLRFYTPYHPQPLQPKSIKPTHPPTSPPTHTSIYITKHLLM